MWMLSAFVAARGMPTPLRIGYVQYLGTYLPTHT